MSFWSDPLGSIKQFVSDPGKSVKNLASSLRDPLESAAVLAGNYLLPGSSLLTSGLASKGSQKQLSSPIGELAQLGTGGAGLGVGSSFTGIPTSAGGNWESSLFSGGSTTNPAGVTSSGTSSTGALDAAGNAIPVNAPESGGFLSKAGQFAKNYAVPLLAGANLFMSSKPQAQIATPAMTTLSAQDAALASSLVNQYNSGQLNAGDAASIAQWQQGQEEATKQYYANAGLSDSSMEQQAIGQVHAQAVQMRQQALNNYLQPALTATGLAFGQAQTLLNYQLQQDQQKQQAQSNFLQVLAQMSYGPAKA